jgi:ribosomal protein L37E
MTTQFEPSHPHHPHHLECPRCGRHTIVIQGETRYFCLSCGWRRDTADEWDPLHLIVLAIALLIALLLII